MGSPNVTLYFGKREKIVPRHEASNIFSTIKSERIEVEGSVLYVQPYQPRPILRTPYNHAHPIQDNLLLEFIDKEAERFPKNKFQVNEEILEWVHREYGEDVFC
jgi:hypothetical protein